MLRVKALVEQHAHGALAVAPGSIAERAALLAAVLLQAHLGGVGGKQGMHVRKEGGGRCGWIMV